MKDLYKQIEKDIRYIEGLKSCFNCGVCTAICPAAEVGDYDPRRIVDTVQKRDESELEKLLKETKYGCAGNVYRVKHGVRGGIRQVILSSCYELCQLIQACLLKVSREGNNWLSNGQ